MNKDAYAFQDAGLLKVRPILPTTMRHCPTHGSCAHEMRHAQFATAYSCVLCTEAARDFELGRD